MFKKTKLYLQATLDSSLYVVQAFKAVRNKSGKIVDFVWVMNNKKAIEQNGDVIGKSLLRQNPGVVNSGLFKQFVQVTETGVEIDQEVYYKHEQFNGWFHQTLVKMDDGFVMNTEDITEKKKNQQKILLLKDTIAQQVKDKYQALFNSIDEGFCIVEAELDKKSEVKDVYFREVNNSFEKQSGFSNAVGKSIKTLLPHFEKYWMDIFTDVIRTGQSVRAENYVMDIDRWYNAYFSLVGDIGSKYIAVVFNDITERKKAEEDDRYLAILTNNMMDAVISTDTKFRIVTWNKGAEDVYQWKDTEVIGKTMRSVLASEFENSFTRKSTIEDLKKKNVWRGELVQRRKNGKKIAVLSTVAVLRNEKKKIIGYVAVNHDISNRKKLERQKDEFIGIASHELKTPVTSLKTFTEIMESRFHKRGDKENAQLLGKMKRQVNKLTGLISELLDVTKIESGKLQLREELFDFDIIVAEIVEEVQRTVKRHVILREGKTNKKLFGDREKIGQAITNLLTNAIKYSPKSTQIILRTSANKKEILLSVQDFGIGIIEAKQQKIFERFYRESGQKELTFPGLGIGLYIAAEIIQRHNGKIWVESQKGKGATFFFSLPIIRSFHVSK